MMFQPRDFLETYEGLFFAAVTTESAFLRYYPSAKGDRQKDGKKYMKVTSTCSSFDFLEKKFPRYIIKKGGYRLQFCRPEDVKRTYDPVEGLKRLCSSDADIHIKCRRLSDFFQNIPQDSKGITGSILIGLERPKSDIDFLIYGKRNFEYARRALTESQEPEILPRKKWLHYYNKRFPVKKSISFEEFLWHEQRKHNLGVIEGTIFNLLLVGDPPFIEESLPLRRAVIRCRVKDADQSFNIPSLYVVDHETVDEVISYTHSYAGQAVEGETVEVAGMLEEKKDGYRIVVGTTREAEGEYIRVIH